jgi:hypothetical protein
MRYLTTFLRAVLGLALIAAAGDFFYQEYHNPARSMMLLAFFGAAMALGALIVPGFDHAIEDGSQKGFKLFSLGRRAYDGKALVPEVEIPAPLPPTGPVA